MPLVEGPPGKPPLGIGWMALALVLAAFLGAAMGLVWQSTGLGEADPDEEEAADQAE